MAELRRLRQLRKQASHVLMRHVYKDIRGIEICQQDKGTIEELKHGQDDKSLTYGEIVSTSFETILGDAIHLLGRETDIIFYDLGSGTGKACLAAVLCYPGVTRSVGLELVPSLHHAASRCLTRWVTAVQCVVLAQAQAQTDMGKGKGSALGPDKAAPRGAPKKGPVGQVLSAGALVAVIRKELRRLTTELARSHGAGAAAASAEEEETAAGTEGCSEARLANGVCLSIGQKDFKASFRAGTNGTFHKFLSMQPVFVLHEVGGAVRVRERAGEKEAEEMGEREGECEGEGEGEVVAQHEAAGGKSVDDAGPAVSKPAAELDLLIQTLSQPHMAAAFGTLGTVLLEEADIFERAPAWHAEADVAYCASLLFTDDMMRRLCEQALQMRPGSVLVSLKPLPLPLLLPLPPPEAMGMAMGMAMAEQTQRGRLRLCAESFYQFSWQKAKVYMYQMQK